MRIPLTALAVVCAACDLTGTVTGPPVASDQPIIQQQSVWLSLGGGQVRVIEARLEAADEQAPPRVAGRVLRYELVGDGGQVIATGAVDDPREVMVEWSENGAFQNAIATRVDPMVRIDVPAVEGLLVVSDDTGVIGSASLTIQAPAPQQINTIAAPVLVSGSGDTASSLDLLFVPDGYTASELALFEADVVEHMNVLFQNPDFAAYRGNINIWRLDVPSNQSGIGESGVARDTAFGVIRSTTIQRLVLISSSAGQAAADQAGRRVGAEKVIVMANTSAHGGSGGPIPVVARTSPDALGHELAHSLLRLADEYDYFGGGGCNPSQAKINVAFSTDPSRIPWANLISAGTPLPTPTSAPRGTIGAFLGADYCQSGAYRAQHDCLMRNLGQPMCAVCRAALDRYMAARTGGSGGGADTGSGTGGGGGTDDGGSDTGGDDYACDYTCHDYGYAPGQCYQGWECEGYCLVNRGTCGGTDTDTGTGTDASCEYACSDYNYSQGQCNEGWQCLADGCLYDVGSCPDTGGDTGGDACTYTCAEYGYAPGQCYQGWLCESSGECLVNIGVCSSGT